MKFLLGACALSLAAAASAQDPIACSEVPQDGAALAAAAQFSNRHFEGPVLRKDMITVTRGLRWHKTLASAVEQARTEHKPIVWIQALGDIKGFT